MSDVRFSREGAMGLITLDRQAALNALTTEMCAAIHRRLDMWIDDPNIAVVAIEGAGKAFCAGGDVRMLAASAKADGAAAREFFQTEYALNTRIKTYPKPYVALIDGACMGGGVGVSLHGAFQAVSERVLWAMPENMIGMIPDVGASWALPRLGKGVGRFLAMVGPRLGRADCLGFGLATHAVAAADFGDLKEAFANLGARAGAHEVKAALDAFHAPDEGGGPLGAHKEAIQTVFVEPSVIDIMAALMRADGVWADEARKSLEAACPFVLAAAFELQNRGAILSFQQTVAMEFRVSNRMIARPDFVEGVRALLIDKTKDPAWSPATVADIDPKDVQRLFDPLPAGELVLA